MTVILDGKKLSEKIKSEIGVEVKSATAKVGRVPGLAVVLVGDNPASKVYVTNKKKSTVEAGMDSFSHELTENTTENELVGLIKKLNDDPKVDGILVQLPLPKHINEEKIINLIDPEKDVDGFHPFNLGRLMRGDDTLKPCTPYGVTKFFKEYNIETKGKHVVIIGRSNIVGKPMANIMVQKGEFANSTVTICHTATEDVSKFTKMADIIIVASGVVNTLTGDMVKEGVVVIDVGINRVKDETTKSGYKLKGDVDFDSVAPKASFITPVPGGVGPMTISMLLENTLKSFKKREKLVATCCNKCK